MTEPTIKPEPTSKCICPTCRKEPLPSYSYSFCAECGSSLEIVRIPKPILPNPSSSPTPDHRIHYKCLGCNKVGSQPKCEWCGSESTYTTTDPVTIREVVEKTTIGVETDLRYGIDV